MTSESGALGPEPVGATPLSEDDLEGLIPDFVATWADLNLVESENIASHLPRARRIASRRPDAVLTPKALFDLHQGMFGDVWRWAGTYRRRQTNIGVEPGQIALRTAQALEDARYWHAHGTYDPDELAARVHTTLVAIHPFPNGNGRCTRLLADLHLHANGHPTFTWGAANLTIEGTARRHYLDALIHAIESDEHDRLVAFARS